METRHRNRLPARRPSSKYPKRRILLVVEGAVTEKKYFEGLIATLRTAIVEFKVLGGVGVPMTIVETAVRVKRSARERSLAEQDDYLNFNEVWCVFDVDQHPKIPDAIRLAGQQNIQLAISNPCFELWLWLHFAEAPGARTSQELQTMLRAYIPEYRKHVRFADLEAGVEAAIVRASRLEELAKSAGDELRNPCTGVWRLAKTIQSKTDKTA